MLPANHEDLAAKLQKLRDDYAARLPAQLDELSVLARQASKPEQQPHALNEVSQRLHKLAGSAGSFGFAALGKQVKQLELQVTQWLTAGGLVDPGQLQVFIVAISTLASALVENAPLIPPAIPTPTQDARQTHIYLLENDAAVADEISLMLHHFGHKVSYFSTVAAAEQAILASAPDFIVADIAFQSEQRCSTDVLTQLQGQLKKPIPVIFMSSRVDFAAYHAAVRAGGVGYFTKPLDVIRLVDFLENYLNSQRITPYRVMIVDDDQDLSNHYRLVLHAAGMLVEVVNTPSELLPALNEFHPEMILLDLHIPECPGPELAKVIRLSDEWLRVPITYLSSETDIDKRILAMGQAGDDFLTKPITDRELVSAVLVRAARSRQLSQAMDRDSLTGLLKHSRIKEQLAKEVARTQRSGGALSVAMIDLDKFKLVNDTYGHPVGDKVIKALAYLLRQRLRKTDVIGRYGGEEFVALLPGCSGEEAQALLNDVRQHFKDLVFQAAGESFSVTLSAGIATLTATAATRADQLLQQADDALYLAKHAGRDQIVVT